jgi:molybdate transport system substrate-binding protein
MNELIMKKILYTTCAIALFVLGGFKSETKSKISIVSAANLKPAMDSIITIYQLKNPKEEILITYGASGKLYEQISNGAPFDVFFSADMNYPKKLKDNKFTLSPVKKYGIGKLVIWSKKMNLSTIKDVLEEKVKKVAIANPSNAPYGAKAIETLKYYKLYNTVKSKIVYGDNIAQTAQFAAFGAVEIGFIALSEALSPAMKKENGKYHILPQESYSSLEQGCVVLKHGKGNTSATKFYDFISSDVATKILTYYGYSQ